MKKEELENLVEKQKQQIEVLKAEISNKDTEWQERFDEQFSYEANSVNISNRDYDHYLRLQETTLQAVERADKLTEANTQLIKAIAELNGGVLKDLSQTIVNLTKKQGY